MLFVAPDKGQLDTLLRLVRSAKAWKSVVDESDRLNLTPANKRDAEARLRQDIQARDESLRLTYKWFLYPEQEPGAKDIRISGIPMDSDGTIAARAAKKAISSDHVYQEMSVSTLRLWIDKLNLWGNGPHLSLGQLAGYFAQHIYLPTLTAPSVLYTTVRDRPDSTLAMNDGFAYAAGFENGRYVGLTLEEVGQANAAGLIVDPAVARKQLDEEAPAPTPNPTPPPRPPSGGEGQATPGPGRSTAGGSGAGTIDVRFPTDHLYAEIQVPLDRPVKVASELAQEVLRHLTANGVEVKVRLDIEADGISKLESGLLADLLNNLRTIGFTVDGAG